MGLSQVGACERRILIIDDDQGTRDTFESALRLDGCHTTCVASGEEGLEAAQRGHFSLVLVDLRLPGLSGLDVIRELVRARRASAIVLMSAYVTLETAVKSIRMGASDVLEKPVDLDHLLTVVRRATAAPHDRSQALGGVCSTVDSRYPSKSIVERWSGYVIGACLAPDDVKTLNSWARHVAISCSTLCASCRLVGVRPLEARDFARVLRTLRLAHEHNCRPQVFLDVSDTRTLRALSVRAGIDLASPVTYTLVNEFLSNQRFVAATNEAMPYIRAFLDTHLLGRGKVRR
jgi:CheY-like chemotaxis protein